MKRPCLSCGALIAQGSRCSRCQRTAPTTRRDQTWQEKRRRRDAVQAWRDEHGDWCPGYGVPAHHAVDLTADHVRAVAAGGADDGALAVLCRSCNGRKGASSR